MFGTILNFLWVEAHRTMSLIFKIGKERNTCVATNSNNVTRLFKEFTCCVEEPKVKILKIMCIDFVPLREQLQIENS
jgi:hypothetical protein